MLLDEFSSVSLPLKGFIIVAYVTGFPFFVVGLIAGWTIGAVIAGYKAGHNAAQEG